MLAVLLFLSLLPLAAMPALHDSSGSGDGGDDYGDDNGNDPTNNPVDPVDPVDPGEEDPTEAYNLDATSGETVIDNFDPGADVVNLDLSATSGDLYYETWQTDKAAIFSVSTGADSVVTIGFQGLPEVPAGDIFLNLVDDVTGDPYEISLKDAMLVDDQPDDDQPDDQPDDENDQDPDDGTDPGEVTDPLDPLDPALPDQPGPDDVTDPLDPLDPALPDNPGPDDVTDPLDPVDPELPDAIVAQAGLPAWLTLPAGNGLGAVQSGAGNADEPGVAEVQDFTVGEHFLQVSLPSGAEGGDPADIQVAPSDDGADGLVTVSGDLVAILRGAPDATTADVRAGHFPGSLL